MPKLTTEAIFVGTTKPEINIKRVANRVRTGAGHDVPMKEIQRRWTAAQDNLARTADCLDRIELIDNSGKETRTVVRIREGGRYAASPDSPAGAGHGSTTAIPSISSSAPSANSDWMPSNVAAGAVSSGKPCALRAASTAAKSPRVYSGM